MQAVYGGQPNTMYPYVDPRGHYQGFPRQLSVSEPQPRPMQMAYNGMNAHNTHNFNINTDGPSYFYGGIPPEPPASQHGTPFPHQQSLLLSNGTPAGVPHHLPTKRHKRHDSLPTYNGEPITRHRTTSYKREEEPQMEPTPPEDMSSSYVYVSFIGHASLQIENLPRNAVKILEGQVFSICQPFHTIQHRRAVAFNFENSPWRVDGRSEDVRGMHMIRELLRSFCYGGYEYCTTMFPKRTAPQLVFTATHKNVDPLFFLIYFTSNGCNVNILDAQHPVTDHLWRHIKRNMPHKRFEIEAQEGFVVIKMQKGSNNKADKRLLKTIVLQSLWDEHPLYATIPLGPKPFGFGFKREVLVFRGIPRRRKR